MTTEQIIHQLRRLSQDEIGTVAAACDSLLASGGKTDQDGGENPVEQLLAHLERQPPTAASDSDDDDDPRLAYLLEKHGSSA